MLIVVSGMAFEAKMAQGADIHPVYGLNPAKLVADMERAIGQGARGILSFGTAAGLSPALASGTAVIARRVRSGGQAYAADEAWAQRLHKQLPDAIPADIAGVDHPLADSEEKSMLWADTGAAAADMESHHAAATAQRHHLPFAALRVVLDGAARALPPAALAATRDDGSLDYGGLLGSLFAHPGQLPALLRLAADEGKARKTLLRCSHLLRGGLFCLQG